MSFSCRSRLFCFPCVSFHKHVVCAGRARLLVSCVKSLSPSRKMISELGLNSRIRPTTLESDQTSSILEETNLDISKAGLFFPPDTDASSSSSSSSNVRILKGSNIVVSKYAHDAKVKQAEFVKSSVNVDACPDDGLPEIALVGRSNVGKSSLLNMLVSRRKLAHISKTPGKTQCINHFKINDEWYLVDLPGYGYAYVPTNVSKEWHEFTKVYFLNRSTLASVFLLIDASIPFRVNDLEYATWLGENEIPMTLIFTKCDKRGKKKYGGSRAVANVEFFLETLKKSFAAPLPWILTSAVTKMGKDQILLHMSQIRNYWLQH